VRIREAGDSAMLMELGAPRPEASDAIDAELNTRAIRIAHAIRQRRIAGVRDVVSAFRSVAVFFDPLVTDVAAVTGALEAGRDDERSEEPGKLVEVPVVYGGDAGPDLADVAAFAGVTPEAVVERHASRTYRVFMLGFLPGFPYMAGVDDKIATPRRPTPRARVPAGSVGIAGRQTGIYPCESPGGWQIIGRTRLEMFDPERSSPALLAPGDIVRFVPVSSGTDTVVGRGFTPRQAGREGPPYAGPTYDLATRYITVLRPGLLTTIQDAGRWGYQHLGVSVSGPMDPFAHRFANSLLGNAPDAATLEATILGPELRFEHRARIAIAGGDLQPTLDSTQLSTGDVVQCAGGSVLRFGDRRSGARAYVAVDGGIAVPRVLGSRSTHVTSGLGGMDGRALRSGDRIALGPSPSPSSSRSSLRHGSYGAGDALLRVMRGPQADDFHPSALDVLQRTRFTISPQSDRMGYRLRGGTLPTLPASGEMTSGATVLGAVQVPPSGQPILLMADRQTTGGYPQIAVVITADLPLAAQLAPGDTVRFELCRRSDAIAALTEQERVFLGDG